MKKGDKMKKPYKLNLLKKVITALEWADDVESGEMIEQSGYTSSYLGDFEDGSNHISIPELNALCTIVNIILLLSGYKTRVSWNAGELRPQTSDERINYLDDELVTDIRLYLIAEINMRLQ